MPIVTISREFGSGGLTIGRRVAELLGADFLDAVLVQEVARRLQVRQDAVERWDERREGVILRLLRALQVSHPEYVAVVSEEGLEPVLDADRISQTVGSVIEEAARPGGNAVIVGRGGVFILKNREGVHHFRLVAAREIRIQRERERSGIGAKEASTLVDRRDREREVYLRHLFGADSSDPHHYALVLNTGVLGPEATARIIVQTASGTPE